MKKLVVLSVAALLSLSFTAMAQMTDSQVTSYLKAAAASGRDGNKVALELASRGVTQDQLERIRISLENDAAISADTGNQSTGNPRQLELIEEAVEVPVEPEVPEGPKIFGHDIFRNASLSFEPNMNTATPEDYKLGPGDEVIIEIWGYNEASIRQTISPEGKINISQVGPVQLGGLTIKEATAKIKKSLRSKYASIGGDRPNSEVSVTLGNIRTVQVNVMGEASVPGTYRLSSFSTVFTALYRAGGVTATGSLRAIKVIRAGEQIGTVDVYGYLFEGKSESDIRLQDGDIIIIPPYVKLVQVDGGVKRPMYYEMVEGETVSTALEYAGGFISGAYKDDVRIERKSGDKLEVLTINESRMNTTNVDDGDTITVGATFEQYANRLEVRGNVFRPGIYEFGGDIKTVKDLVNAAGGLREDAFLPRAIITRELPDLTNETISVAIGDIMDGKSADISLKNNDVLTISSNTQIYDRGTMTIRGLVSNPDTFPFAENTSVEDLIIRAGGLLEGASTARVEVYRRKMDKTGLMPENTIGESFTFAIKDGFAVDGAAEFILKPYDVVVVRRSPTVQAHKFVTVSGEVAFPGSYAILDRNEKLSDLIARAGGITPSANLKGGMLTRTASEEDRNLRASAKRMINVGNMDDIDNDQMTFGDKYTVGIDMEKAVKNPGSASDIIVRDGDEIFVPEYVATVSIQGDVMYPNVVQYIPGKNLSYYINQAGGYGLRAKKCKVYIVYQNGNVSRASEGKVEPGSEIVVPTKGEKRQVNASEYLHMSSSVTSLAAMVIALIKSF